MSKNFTKAERNVKIDGEYKLLSYASSSESVEMTDGTDLQTKMNATDKSISDEVTRATTKETEIANNLSAEITRATTAEQDLDSAKADKTSVYTKNEVDNKFSTLETNIDWKESVATYADIATTYPNPEDGWTVNVKDTDYTYRYNGTEWVAISANAIPKATNSIDGLLSKEDHTNYEDANSKKHTHSNKSILDGISSANISDWNAAKSHADSAHAPTNAQANVIETVKVNGTALTPSSKAVDVTVPTKVSQLNNDSGYITSYNNTTYSLSKSGSTITLSGSDGSTTSVTDSDTWRPLGTTADTACAGNDSRLSNARPAIDVYAWAKASSKPSYTYSEVGAASASHTHDYIPTSASCNKNWSYSGQGGQPTWLWGSNDGSNCYVWNPSNFSVNYANSAGSANSATNATNSTYASNVWTQSHNGSWYINSNWDGTYFQTNCKSTDGSTLPIKVNNSGYADSAGNADTLDGNHASAFLTGITKTMVTNALGYTPPTQDTNTWRGITTSLSSTDTSISLAASAGKSLQDQITTLNSNLTKGSDTSYSSNGYTIYYQKITNNIYQIHMTKTLSSVGTTIDWTLGSNFPVKPAVTQILPLFMHVSGNVVSIGYISFFSDGTVHLSCAAYGSQVQLDVQGLITL